MTRQEKYPETPTFHYHQANPHNRINGDCVIRAISVFLGISWTECVKEMTECGLKKGLILNAHAQKDRQNQIHCWRILQGTCFS